jgi:hypothetical protein
VEREGSFEEPLVG